METIEQFVSLCSDPRMVSICVFCVGVLVGFGLCTAIFVMKLRGLFKLTDTLK